jgi:peptidoglycan/LPS O-acetylase OafA/YrhL
MAKKSRKRRRKPRPKPAPAEAGAPAGGSAEAAPVRAQPKPAPRRRRDPDPEGAPPAPWGSFPLVEIAVLVGIVILVLGFLSEGARQAILMGTGLVLCSVAGLELAIREHMGGYRSHTLVLAAVPAVATLAVLFYLAPEGIGPLVRIGLAAVVFGLCAWGLTIAFRNRSGGHSFRVKAPGRRR